ncbi:MAG TPA: carboxypeptidase-like regulatory domain-containing protein, partial [Bacteroidales bacterium]|nr:carboxypeptidase-like regulatory domain-containing protein [Bacteroidales bacterium]
MFNKIILFALAMLPLGLAAQFTLQGDVITADSREALAGAHLTLNPGNQHLVTDVHGKFEFKNLKTGTYVLNVSFIGFENEVEEIHLQQDETLSFVLKPAAFLQDEVVVRASRPEPKTPLTYSVVDAAELREKNSGADLPYLLQQTPSLVVSSDAGTVIGYTSMRIRGTDIS